MINSSMAGKTKNIEVQKKLNIKKLQIYLLAFLNYGFTKPTDMLEYRMASHLKHENLISGYGKLLVTQVST